MDERHPPDVSKMVNPVKCHRCNIIVEATTKHCRLCEKCVEGFDHHCLYLNQCIGKVNYPLFLGLLLLTWLLLSVQVGSVLFHDGLSLIVTKPPKTGHSVHLCLYFRSFHDRTQVRGLRLGPLSSLTPPLQWHCHVGVHSCDRLALYECPPGISYVSTSVWISFNLCVCVPSP